MKRLFQRFRVGTLNVANGIMFIRTHKIASGVAAILIIGGGYYAYRTLTNTSGETKYVLANVERGTLVASITGSGQVSASNQIDLKPKASGDVIAVPIQNGQDVRSGQLIAELDASDAEKAVRDAKANLESANLALQKLQQPADTLSLLQAQNSLDQSQGSLVKDYDDGYTAVSNAFLNLPTVMSGLQDILYGTTINRGQDNISAYTGMVQAYDETVTVFRDDAARRYQAARTAYDRTFADYKASSRYDSPDAIVKLVGETYDTTKTVAEAVKSANDFLNFVKDRLTERLLVVPVLLTTHQGSLATYTGDTNTHLASLSSVQDAITSDTRSIAEKTESLAKLKRGADPLDIASQELAVTQRQNALLDAQDKLADYFIRAPFDGTIAKVNVKKADSVSAGTAIATIISKQQIAEISLNEVDVAKVKAGEQATLTFDAVSGLTIAGIVAEVDTVGTVTQGVVTYNVKIAFTSQDSRMKPGMSVSAAIITDVKQNVLMVPNSAVKTQGNTSYVEMFSPPLVSTGQASAGVTSAIPPQAQAVEIGLSNDTSTEIVSGLNEGDQIITRTITPSATAAQQAPNLFGATGAGGRGGATGGTRIPAGGR